jgi:hypothetical protein
MSSRRCMTSYPCYLRQIRLRARIGSARVNAVKLDLKFLLVTILRCGWDEIIVLKVPERQQTWILEADDFLRSWIVRAPLGQ